MKMMKNKKVVEKIVELKPYRSGLKMTAGKKNTQNSSKTKNFGLFHMVPVTGLEPVRCRQRWILSPLRLPIHHTGRCLDSIHQVLGNIKRKIKKGLQKQAFLFGKLHAGVSSEAAVDG